MNKSIKKTDFGIASVNALRRATKEMKDEPIPGVQYALTGKKGDKCIMNGNSWDESKVDSICTKCGNSDDLLTAFTDHKVCGKCSRNNHKNI